MASDLYAYSQDLKSKARSFDQTGEIVSLDFTSDLTKIKAAQGPAGRSPQLLEYWACIFLLSCEDNDPCIQILAKSEFLNGFEEALKSISRVTDQVIVNLYAECIDGILVNEFLSLNEDTRHQEITEILEKLMKYFTTFNDYNFSFRTHVYNYFSQLWLKIHEFNEADAPGDGIINVSKQLWVARRCGVFIEEVSQVLADSIFEYIDNLNQNSLDVGGFRHKVESIQTSHILINQLEEYCQDPEVKETLNIYREKLTGIYPYHEDRPIIGEICSYNIQELNSISYSRLVSLNKSKYVMSRGPIRVNIGKYRLDGKIVCVKSYSFESINRELDKVYREIDIYKMLSDVRNNENCFIECFGTSLENNEIHIVLEWYDQNLMEIINQRMKNQSDISEQTFLDIALKLIRSFAIMASKRIYHNDIKPHNIMAREIDWSMKIIDFDASLIKTIQDGVSYSGIQGTDGYNSPEKDRAKSKDEYDPEKSDVYSLGLVLFQFLTYENVNKIDNKKILSIIDEKLGGYNENTRRFLKLLLEFSPEQRPNFNESLMELDNVKKTVTRSSHKKK